MVKNRTGQSILILVVIILLSAISNVKAEDTIYAQVGGDPNQWFTISYSNVYSLHTSGLQKSITDTNYEQKNDSSFHGNVGLAIMLPVEKNCSMSLYGGYVFPYSDPAFRSYNSSSVDDKKFKWNAYYFGLGIAISDRHGELAYCLDFSYMNRSEDASYIFNNVDLSQNKYKDDGYINYFRISPLGVSFKYPDFVVFHFDGGLVLAKGNNKRTVLYRATSSSDFTKIASENPDCKYSWGYIAGTSIAFVPSPYFSIGLGLSYESVNLNGNKDSSFNIAIGATLSFPSQYTFHSDDYD